MAEGLPLRGESKISLLAVFVAVVLAMGGYAIGKIEQTSIIEQKVKTIDENYISKDRYNTDMEYMKNTLAEIKSDVKEVKKGLK